MKNFPLQLRVPRYDSRPTIFASLAVFPGEVRGAFRYVLSRGLSLLGMQVAAIEWMLRFARIGLGLGIVGALAGPLTCSDLSVEQAGGRLSTAATRPAPPGDASVAAHRGWIGARFAMDSIQIDEPSSAARVVRVVPELAGARAGLQAGDLVVAVGSHRIDSRAALRDALVYYPPGATIELAICRDGRHQTLVGRLDTADDVARRVHLSRAPRD